MPALEYPAPIQRLISQFKALPGIGPRSAERIVLWMLATGRSQISPLSIGLTALETQVQACDECGFYSQMETPCLLCSNDSRHIGVICVVEHASDVIRLERSGAFHGLYHVLGGKLSPLDNVTPEDLRIDSLLQRVSQMPATEVILALSSDVEGEATSNYLTDLMSHRTGLRITRLAQGMPAGGNLDHVDEMTLHRALQGRREVGA